jgi:macrolide-specific efflux system membrane fusion protein
MKFLQFMKRPWVIVLLILILGGGGYFVYRAFKGQEETTTYKTATVTKGTLTATVSATGNVEVVKTANVAPSISGDVYDLAVKVGDTVAAGATLFKIDNDDLDLTVSKAYASVLQAQQSLTEKQNSLTTAQNNQTTINDDANSTDTQKSDAANQVNSATIAVQVAEINLKSAQSEHSSAKTEAAKRTVKAPIAGTITEVNVANDEALGSSGNSSSSSTSDQSTTGGSSSSASIVISDLGCLQVAVTLNEVDAVNVQAGQSASMTFDAIDDLTLTGKVINIGTVGTESSGVVTYPITISFDSLDNRIKPQMSATALITTNMKQNVLMVSNSALKSSGDESYVLLMKDGSPIKQTVVIGIANDSYTEVTEGLSENDTIVTQTITSGSTSTDSSSNSRSSGSSSLGGLTSSGGPPSGGVGGPGM